MSLVLALACLVASAASAWRAWRLWPALEGLFGPDAAWIAAAEALAVLSCAAAALGARRHRRQLGVVALVRIVLCGLGLAWTSFLLAVPSGERLWLQLAIGPAAGCIAWMLCFEHSSAPWRPARSRAARALLVALALAPPLAEGLLRGIARWHPAPILALGESAPGRVLESKRRLISGPRFGFALNSGGHYDEEFRPRAPGETRLALIGDSFSWGVVPHPLHYSTLAEQALGFPVDNFGLPGTGPPEYEQLLVDEVLPLDPSAVVVAFFVGNDFELPDEKLEAARSTCAWIDRSQLLVWLVPTRLSTLLRERRENPEGIAGRQAESDPLDPARSLEQRYPWLADPRLERASISKQGFLELERSRASNSCRGTEEYLMRPVRVLARMRDECAGRPFGVLLIPDEFQVEDALWQELALPIETERDRPQSFLLRELGKLGIPVLDLLPVLRAVAPLPDGRRHLYHLRDTHWNARGNRFAAGALAPFVKTLASGATGAGR